jgi:dynein heavy chain
MYLENIFVGSEDIRKQLPQESLMFDGVNMVFTQGMAQLHAVGNVIQATSAPGVLASFQVSGLAGMQSQTDQLAFSMCL